jgi:competence protein ComEA
MDQPLKYDVPREPDSGISSGSTNDSSLDSGSTKSASSPSVWKPVITRVVLSGLALLGLAGVGAASMFAGLDGARANSPRVTVAQSPSSTINPVSTPDSASPAASGGAAAPPASASSQSQPPATATCAGRTADGRVVLNMATVADLRTLPGIGQKRADAILALRDKLKKFRRIQELRRVRGIGAKTLQKLAPKLLVDPPPGTC